MRVKQQSQAWIKFIQKQYETLLNCESIPFRELVPSKIPQVGGVYLITALKNGYEVPYYVGRTTNLRGRIYTNHIMGNLKSSSFKKTLVTNGVCKDSKAAKEFIQNYCSLRWIEEANYRTRGAIEGYSTGLLFPSYGIYKEH
ncbi:GIY-YIG nuclease family protein [Chloroflexota bacterium]